MARAGDVIRNPVTGETVTFVVTTADSDGKLLRLDTTAEPGKAGPPMHVHRRFTETHELVEGTLAVTLEGIERMIEAPGRFTIPRGAPHTFRVNGDTPVRTVVDYEPAGGFEDFVETVYALARDGKTDEQGRPKLLQTAVIGRRHLDDFALSSPPVFLQRILFALLAPVGRLAGYGSRYPGNREE